MGEALASPLTKSEINIIPKMHDIHLDMARVPPATSIGEDKETDLVPGLDGRVIGHERVKLGTEVLEPPPSSPIDDFLLGSEVSGWVASPVLRNDDAIRIRSSSPGLLFPVRVR